MHCIAITGTPGTGKSKVAKKFASMIGYNYVDLNKEIVKYKLYSSYDRKRKTYVADMSKISKFVRLFNSKTVFDSHLSHLLKCDTVFVLRCSPEVLLSRLKRRHWSKQKIKENYEAELISLISYEARRKHKKVFDVDATSKTISDIARKLVLLMKKRSNKPIDWLAI